MLIKDPNLKKKLLKRSDSKPKTLDDLLKNLSSKQLKPTFPVLEGPVTKKIKCKRLAGRETVVGNTVFSFNKDGICEFKPRFRAGEMDDFSILIRKPGVEEIVEEQPRVYVEEYIPVAAPEPQPESFKYEIGDQEEIEDKDYPGVIEIDMAADDTEPVVKRRKSRKSKTDI